MVVALSEVSCRHCEKGLFDDLIISLLENTVFFRCINQRLLSRAFQLEIFPLHGKLLARPSLNFVKVQREI